MKNSGKNFFRNFFWPNTNEIYKPLNEIYEFFLELFEELFRVSAPHKTLKRGRGYIEGVGGGVAY
jgi:hypothetical protein